MFQIIDGKKISQEIKDELKEKVSALKTQGKTICLAVIQVGSDPASSVYVGNKKKACAYIGIESLSYELTEETTEQELLDLVKKLNADDAVNGILVQRPSRLMNRRSFRPLRRRRTSMDFMRKAWGRSAWAAGALCRARRLALSSF